MAGKTFAIIASDTRLSAGFSIYTREQPKLFKLYVLIFIFVKYFFIKFYLITELITLCLVQLDAGVMF